jgi:hypothetical protein
MEMKTMSDTGYFLGCDLSLVDHLGGGAFCFVVICCYFAVFYGYFSVRLQLVL